MNKMYKRGFTLIELLVVIAIIGILSSVVLASLNTARNKGADAAVKSNLNNIRAQAELVYDGTNSYATVCADSNVYRGVQKAWEATGTASTTSSCNDAAGSWTAYAPLKTSGFWCVDSSGNSRKTAAALTAGATICN